MESAFGDVRKMPTIADFEDRKGVTLRSWKKQGNSFSTQPSREEHNPANTWILASEISVRLVASRTIK